MIPFVPTYHNGYQLIVLWPIRILAGVGFAFLYTTAVPFVLTLLQVTVMLIPLGF